MINHHPHSNLAIVDNLESEVEVKFFGERSSEIDRKSFISEKDERRWRDSSLPIMVLSNKNEEVIYMNMRMIFLKQKPVVS